MFALADCNNFYVSCERVFHPKWNDKPVVILSNNDGCVIARSNEAKALGIPMGAPFFKYKDVFFAHDVIVCSSNFTLYGDMSDRVMNILKQFSPDFQIYSIDEAFMSFDVKNPLNYGIEMRQTVLQWTGIPVSIGIASTKTLAKVANHYAKKNPTTGGVYVLLQEHACDLLDTLPVTEIWGIGSRYGKRLNRLGIFTAKDLCDADDTVIRKHLSVVGLRTTWELRGVSCLPLEEIPPPKKSITCSRSFGKPIDTLTELNEAIASYTARAAEKIRWQNSLASTMIVFVELHPYRKDSPACFHMSVVFSEPTDYTPHLIHYAKTAVAQLFCKGNSYRKAGIILDGLVSNQSYQRDLFAPSMTEKQKTVMKTVDQINDKFGRSSIHSAAEGTQKSWKMKQQKRTDLYTTDWDQLLKIQI